MHIEINDNTTIRQIQEIFSNYYPYLKLEFYRRPHNTYERSEEGDVLFPGNTIGKVKKTHLSALLEMKPLSTIAEIEKEFLRRFGLSVQVLRKENDKWVQTTGMDDFTLKFLNEMSRNASDEFILSEPDSEFKEGE